MGPLTAVRPHPMSTFSIAVSANVAKRNLVARISGTVNPAMAVRPAEFGAMGTKPTELKPVVPENPAECTAGIGVGPILCRLLRNMEVVLNSNRI